MYRVLPLSIDRCVISSVFFYVNDISKDVLVYMISLMFVHE